MQTKKSSPALLQAGNFIAAVIGSLIIAAGIGFILYDTGLYLHGSSVYAQMYKVEVLAESIADGVWFPPYAGDWYNGYEIFRYTSPFAYLPAAVIQQVFHADIHISICVFYGLMAFVSQMGFMLFGIREKKRLAAFLTGLAFLLLPTTFSILILEGSLDAVMSLAFMPLALFFLHDFMKRKHRIALLPFSGIFCLIILADYIAAIAFGIVLLLYLIFYAIAARAWRYAVAVIANMLILYVIMGYYLYPAIAGGLLSKDNIIHGNVQPPVSIALLVIAVIGLITADRSRVAGFLSTVLFIVLALPVMEPVRKMMSSPILEKTYWYLLIAVTIFMVTLLCWQRLRPVFLVIALCVIVGENIPQIASLGDGNRVLQENEAFVTDYLLEEAAAYTDNRVVLMDLTRLGAFPQWYFAGRGVDTMGGWDFDSALTTRNLTTLNEAFADGFYDYMFDRMLLYGNDTAIILKEFLEEGAYDTLIAAGARNGYEVWSENDKALVFKAAAVNGSYGVVTQYTNMAIGTDAAYIAYIYPSFAYGNSDYLDDYTITELEQYQKLFLAGFTYRDKETAENMLKELSRKGTEIYIDMQHIPVNALTGKNEFMGVYAQYVQFTEDFPILENDNGNQFKLDFKAGGYDVWDTVYISGCEEIVKESIYENNNHLVYLGKNYEPNVTFMGFNLLYYYLTTHNQDLKRFLDEALQISSEDLHEPVIVPVQIEKEPSRITVHTEEDGVNCSLAAVDALTADRIVSTQENLLVVNQGDTIFNIVYAGRREGKFFSIIGLIALGIIWISVYVLLENDDSKKTDEVQ
ncbi:MAG: 6-pyruvoyl-tetrahydropterin synthase-related protein [Ruminococcus sp.]|nr:6-pyruvoyl-tetrahydropterin synthase-related protein [Ruminococcus sp.]